MIIWQRTMAITFSSTLLSALLSTGSDPQQWRAQPKSGDTVQLTLRDGSVKEINLNAMGADSLSSGGQQIAFADISQLSRKQLDGGKTTWLVVGLVAVAAAASGGGGGDSGY